MVANDASLPRLRRLLIAFSALAVGFSLSAAAQTSTASDDSSGSASYSSSNIQALLSPDAFMGGTPSASADPYAVASPQYGGNRQRYPQYPGYESKMSHFAFEGGGGFSAPSGYTSRYESWGYDFTVGGGWNFSKRVGALMEYSFLRQGMSSSYLNQVSTANSLSNLGGNFNTWSFTIDPILYQPLTKRSGVYITGGGGFYRKVTNFTEPVQQCYFDEFYGYVCGFVPATVAHYSSNQGGLNIGVGLYWKAFGPDSNAKLYAETRYVWVDSPALNPNTGLGTGREGLFPVAFGIRF